MIVLKRFMVAAAVFLAVGSAASGIGLYAVGQRQEKANAGQAADGAASKDEPDSLAGKKARDRSNKNLRTIALAMQNFASLSEGQRFAPAAIRKDGKPLLSWRVAILPLVGEQALYDEFHLDEPWDGRHNKRLLSRMPDLYAPVVRSDEPRVSTYYQVFTGPGALFEDVAGPRIPDIKDGVSNTILVVEAGSPVPWTKPEDLVIEADKTKPLPKLGRQFENGFHAVFADGSVRFFQNGTSPKLIRALISRDGGEVIDRGVLPAVLLELQDHGGAEPLLLPTKPASKD